MVFYVIFIFISCVYSILLYVISHRCYKLLRFCPFNLNRTVHSDPLNHLEKYILNVQTSYKLFKCMSICNLLFIIVIIYNDLFAIYIMIYSL